MEPTNSILDHLFEQARNQAPKYAFSDTKKQFLQTVQPAGSHFLKGQGLNLKSWIMIIATITAVSITTWVWWTPQAEELPNKPEQMVTQSATIQDYEQKVKAYDSIQKEKERTGDAPNKVVYIEPIQPVTADQEPERQQLANVREPDQQEAQLITKRNIKIEDEPYRFPVLTPEMVKDNHKQKAKMLKQLLKLDKSTYAHIPGNEQLDPFYMQKTEVSVLEYRTFLFDLLIQKRKDDFLKAKPDQQQWTKSEGSDLQSMQDHYFSHPAYNNYPVNNISRTGAEMYCQWMLEELNALDKKSNTEITHVRIPTTAEWTYAAKGGLEKSPYPWGGPYLRNSKGCYLANFYPEKDDYAADGAFLTIMVNSYAPNNYGLYCLSGNVAEMTYNGEGRAESKGGSYKSLAAQVQLNADPLFIGITAPSVEIGFRPVITSVDAKKRLIGSLGNKKNNYPGTVKINDGFYFDEQEVDNFSWQFYLYWQKKYFGETSQEYQEAWPDTNVWDDSQKAFRKHYLKHEAYRDYPVVGVTYQQAKAFCKWRTERVKELFEVKKMTYPNFHYRLPTQQEWERMAKAGYDEKTTKKLEGKFKDSFRENLKRSKADRTGTAGKPYEHTEVIAPGKAYWPNKYGVYNIIGNVAEMIDQKGIAKGGSWQHTKEEAHWEDDITYTKPENWLGFRCVCEVEE